MKRLRKQLLISFAFTWFFWIAGFVLLERFNLPLYTQEGIFHLFESGFLGKTHIIAFILFSLGVYGPLVGYFFTSSKKSSSKGPLNKGIVIFIFLFPILIGFLPGVISSLLAGGKYSLALPILTMPFYFVYQLLTSSTEEFGWRGIALPELMKRNSTLEAGWKLGWIWALWHFPLVIYLYKSIGIVILVPTLIGFTFNIIGMSIIYAFLYKNSGSLLLMMVFHALTNTASAYFLGAVDNPVIGLLPAFIVWISVFILQKRFGESLEI